MKGSRHSPCKGKSLIRKQRFCPFRAIIAPFLTQGVALGWRLIAPSGRYRVIADNHLNVYSHEKSNMPFCVQYLRQPDPCRAEEAEAYTLHTDGL